MSASGLARSVAATPLAASSRTRAMFEGQVRGGRVLAVFDTAVYAEVGADLVVVETTDGLRLPRAATLGATSRTRPFSTIRVGDEAAIGAGSLTIGPLALVVRRWWSPRPPKSVTALSYDDARLREVASSLRPLSRSLAAGLQVLEATLLRTAEGPVDLATSVASLVGLGQGLTPEGDDVLSGLLVGLAALPDARPRQRLREAVVARSTHTTALSAALLRDAADGFGIPALVDVVDALLGGAPVGGARPTTTHRALTDTVVRLLAVGHTSGAALVHGALAAGRLHAATHARTKVA